MSDANPQGEPVVESSSSGAPDYSAVDLPSTDRSEYNYVQRRAEILQLIEEAGHPKALNQTQLADRYNVSQQQVSKDLQRLSEHVRERVGDRGRRALMVDATVQRAICGLLDEEEWRRAAVTAIEYSEWASEFADLERLEAKVERLSEEVAARDGAGGDGEEVFRT